MRFNTLDFNACVDSDKYEKDVSEAITYAQSIGVNGTPATFVNGKLISGAVSYNKLKEMIEEELKK